jgi:hypothetical protein
MTTKTHGSTMGDDHIPGTTTSSFLNLMVAVLAFWASVAGVFKPQIYSELLSSGAITNALIFGSTIQDLISIPASVLLFLVSIAFIKKRKTKTLILMQGLSAYFFYGYGLYAIQGQYTSLYFIYLAILGISIYSLIFGCTGLATKSDEANLPKSVRYSIGVFIAIILVVLVPAWIGRMMPDVINRAPGELYGVFILDLAIVFPALAMIAVQLFRGNKKSVLFAGVALVKTFTLCLSVALGEWLKPVFGFSQDIAMIVIFTLLTVISAVLSMLYFARVGLTKMDE